MMVKTMVESIEKECFFDSCNVADAIRILNRFDGSNDLFFVAFQPGNFFDRHRRISIRAKKSDIIRAIEDTKNKYDIRLYFYKNGANTVFIQPLN